MSNYFDTYWNLASSIWQWQLNCWEFEISKVDIWEYQSLDGLMNEDLEKKSGS
jgi:hypothetical protein